MSRNPERDRAARERTTEHLLDEALALFAERGFQGATMADLAKRAGVSKGLAYHYFTSKEALLDGLVARHVARVTALGAVMGEGPPLERIGRFAHALAAQTEAEPEGFRLMMRLLGEVRPQVGPPSDGLVRLFEEHGAADPALEARFFHSALLGILVQCALSPRPTPVAPLVTRLLQALGGPR